MKEEIKRILEEDDNHQIIFHGEPVHRCKSCDDQYTKLLKVQGDLICPNCLYELAHSNK